jgi:arylsulfatase A-like enzyme
MFMNRRHLLQLTTASVAANLIPTAAAKPAPSPARKKQPNLLFLFTDQQRQDTLAAYGNHQIKVPNLNKLAAESVVFHNYYCTQPICTPSRGSLLTGLWPHTHGEYTNNIPLDPAIPVLVEMLPPHKYRTAYFGKWHLGNEIFQQRGFDEFESTEDIYDKFYSKDNPPPAGEAPRTRSGYYRFLIAHGQQPGPDGEFTRGQSNALPVELSKPAYLAELASSFLDETKSKPQPWIMYVNFLDPHSPFGSAYNSMYDPKSMPVPATFNTPPSSTDLSRTEVIRTGLEKRPTELSTEEVLRREMAHYWGKVSLVDTMVGRILARLAETNQYEDTIIVFTTDHGEMMGDHHLMYKSVMYEEAAKVPMLVKIPGLVSHPGVPTPTSGIDVVPTLLDLLGEQIPPHLQGESWAPYLKAGKTPPPHDVIIEWNGPPYPLTKEHLESLRTLRTLDGWKLTLAATGEGELFNLNTDPKETHNLFYEESSLPLIQQLSAKINLWQKSTGDQLILFDNAAWKARRSKLASTS